MGSPIVVDMLKAGGVPAALAEPEELAQVVVEGIENNAFWLNPTPDQDERFFGGRLKEIHEWQGEMIMNKAHAMIEQTPPDPYLWSPGPYPFVVAGSLDRHDSPCAPGATRPVQ